MKPVAIFRHLAVEGPGYFATYLTQRDVPWRLVRIDEGEAVPGDPLQWSGLVFMGGPMSANDDLPWIGEELALIRAAVDCEVPVLGHCLGGQFMAKALGGEVTRNAVKEIGWGGSRFSGARSRRAGSATNLRHSSHFTGTARRSPYPRARRGYSRTRIARTRRSLSARTWACSVTWR